MMKGLGWVLMLGMGGLGVAQTAPAPDAAAVATTATTATPAMWKVKGVHGTLYLFGTVHVMKPGLVWETAKVSDALKSSDTLYLEIANMDKDSVAAMQPMILSMGMDTEHPLSSKISKADVDLLDTAVKGLGLPGESMFEPMKPWMAYMTLSVLPAMQAGYQADSGIDMKLADESKGAARPVKGFETMEQQLKLFAEMPEVQQVDLLHQELVELPSSQKKLDEIVADWSRGDVDKIAALENDDLKVKYPALYKVMLVDRNVHFADALEGLLKDPKTGTVFIAIGAAHLAGPDSVLKDLEKKGFTAQRVE